PTITITAKAKAKSMATGKQRTSADPEPKSLPKLGREQTKPLLIGLDAAGEAKRQHALVEFKFFDDYDLV
ncbi:MAG: hypothetical protein NTX25_06425, partial [Proteobacteria bacterium]|nr:hypothetical protein [Pseudomonadota bacterium]